MISGFDCWNISGQRSGARQCGGFLPLIGSDFDNALEDDGGVTGDSRPMGHGPCGIRALARPRNRSASGQAAAKARRTRPAVSVTRAAILRSLSLIVVNSAVAKSRGFGMASRTVRMSQ